MIKIIVKVPTNTTAYYCGERYAVCLYNGELQKFIEFFKSWNDVINYKNISECENYVNKLEITAV